MILTFRPITLWPDGWPRAGGKDSPFRAGYSDTLTLLDRELAHLRATDVTLALDTSERNCRLDGQIRADARVDYRGVILSFDTKEHGHLTYSCDAFTRPFYGPGSRNQDWQHNLRAIAQGLEALRKVERYGIANRGQQYAGYAELGSGIALGPAPMTLHQASVILAEAVAGELPGINGGDLMDDPETPDKAAVERVYTIAAKLHHPDVGGDGDTFATITRARELLLAAGGN